MPSVKMAARARPHHSARAIPLVLPLPVLPRDDTAHLTTCTPLLASSASPRFWLPPPVKAPEPGSRYSYLAERTRGGGSASGEVGPGLVFVNLPRSRRGQRQPRGWHSVQGLGGGVARRGRQLEAAPGRFLEQIVNFIKRIQLENQDLQTFSSDNRQEPDRVQGFLKHLTSLWRTLSFI